jgi:hypothetical protein
MPDPYLVNYASIRKTFDSQGLTTLTPFRLWLLRSTGLSGQTWSAASEGHLLACHPTIAGEAVRTMSTPLWTRMEISTQPSGPLDGISAGNSSCSAEGAGGRAYWMSTVFAFARTTAHRPHRDIEEREPTASNPTLLNRDASRHWWSPNGPQSCRSKPPSGVNPDQIPSIPGHDKFLKRRRCRLPFRCHRPNPMTPSSSPNENRVK